MAGTEFSRHLTGAGQFVDDLRSEGVLHGHVLRSPHAHAELVGMEVEAALAQPGVVAILTAADLKRDGVGPIPCLWPVEQSDGSPAVTPPNLALASDRVRHVGDAVAFVVAESRHAALDGAESIEVDFAPLPSEAPDDVEVHDPQRTVPEVLGNLLDDATRAVSTERALPTRHLRGREQPLSFRERQNVLRFFRFYAKCKGFLNFIRGRSGRNACDGWCEVSVALMRARPRDASWKKSSVGF